MSIGELEQVAGFLTGLSTLARLHDVYVLECQCTTESGESFHTLWDEHTETYEAVFNG